jgi:aconitate hydratase
VPAGLIRTILEAHGDEGQPPVDGGAGREFVLRPDHVMAGGVAAVVTLAGFETLGLPRITPDVAVVGAERHDPAAAFEASHELRELQESAARSGAMFVRPGEGRCEQVHLERLAAPGRVLFSAGRRSPVAGALGMLVVPCGALEAAAALAGRGIERRWPGELEVELTGEPAAWSDGHDLVCALLRRLGPEGSAGRWIEFTGTGLAALGIASRFTAAREIERLRSPAALFPSDEITRGFLSAVGRDSDWRRLGAGPSPSRGASATLALDALEPMTVAPERHAIPHPIGHDLGQAVGAVLIGSAASLGDLMVLDRVLAGRSVSDGTQLVIVIGSRLIRASAEASGALARLVEAGATVAEGAPPPSPAANGLAYGALPSDWPPGKTQWRSAALSLCALAARDGRLRDPRDEDWPRESAAPPMVGAEVLRLAPFESSAAPPPGRRVPLGSPLEGPLRGHVLLRLGDHVGSDQVLPWGARVRSLVGDFAALSEHAFGDLDAGFAARARAYHGGFIVAGERFGEGVPWDTAALVLVQLGVRAVMARSLAGDFGRLLAQAGVLPLAWSGGDTGRGVNHGDELEMPGVPEAFVSGRPIVVRNLTQGSQYTLRHALGAHEVERLRRGGLLAEIVGARAGAGVPA